MAGSAEYGESIYDEGWLESVCGESNVVAPSSSGMGAPVLS